MRLFIATLSTETNTFSTMPTGLSGFEAYFLRRGTATQEPANLMTEALHVWRQRGEALGWEVTESLAAIAEPAGRTVASVYDALSGEILADLEAVGGADVILLQLHGAMVAEHVEDCEGDLVGRIRAACPGAVIGVGLDQHCHLTEAMLTHCDVINGFKEYPHDDATPRAEELFELARRTVAGEIRPVMAMFDCRMIGLFLTKQEPMRGFVDALSQAEAEPGILSVTLGHGFPWGDVADVGARMLVVADGDMALAAQRAEELGRAFFALRDVVSGQFVPMDAALDRAEMAPEGPVVVADMGDVTGGGAPGDATVVLREMLRRKTARAALGIIWDPMVVRQCEDAGVGSRIMVRLGGKMGAMSGDPLDLDAQVMQIARGLGQHLGPGLEPLGTLAWLRVGEDFDILVNDLRVQVYHPEAFEQMGVGLADKQVVAIKSLFHFYAPFAAIASEVIQMATPGGTCPDFRALELTRRGTPYWPRVEAPFAR